jgi:hypothetical protein
MCCEVNSAAAWPFLAPIMLDVQFKHAHVQLQFAHAHAPVLSV